MPTTEDVSEHPITFFEWDVRRVLAEAKTQKRKIMKPQPNEEPLYIPNNGGMPQWATDGQNWTCPYGQPGDVLWVREAFRVDSTFNHVPSTDLPNLLNCNAWLYEAEEKIHRELKEHIEKPYFDEWGKKRSADEMPREFSRLRLRVEDVSVERVQKISGEDARAEGVRREDWGVAKPSYKWYFAKRWKEIYGDEAWEKNPWVWAVSFSRIE